MQRAIDIAGDLVRQRPAAVLCHVRWFDNGWAGDWRTRYLIECAALEGETVTPLLYEGTTHLPHVVEALSEAVSDALAKRGLSVYDDWEEFMAAAKK